MRQLSRLKRWAFQRSLRDKVHYSKDFNTFVVRIKEIGVSKSKTYFKMKVVQILKKFPKLKKSSLSLIFSKIICRQ